MNNETVALVFVGIVQLVVGLPTLRVAIAIVRKFTQLEMTTDYVKDQIGDLKRSMNGGRQCAKHKEQIEAIERRMRRHSDHIDYLVKVRDDDEATPPHGIGRENPNAGRDQSEPLTPQ